jgi:hypothetical protein
MKEISIPNCRWILHNKTGKTIVENHDHGRTWKKVYKDNFGNVEALCLQLIPSGTKYYIDISPFGEYWVFEEFEAYFGGANKHITRNICSMQEQKVLEDGSIEVYWIVLTIDINGEVSKTIMTSKEIGYETLTFILK